MICPSCRTENGPAESQCVRCGVALTPGAVSAPNVPPLTPPPGNETTAPFGYPPQTPPAFPGQPPASYPPSGYAGQAPPSYPSQYGPPAYPGTYPAPYQPAPTLMDSMIPAKNPGALTGYYLAVFSIIPVLGIFLGIGAFILGIMGLKAANRNPAIKGKSHAWVAILVGGFFGFGYLILIAWAIIAALLATSHTRY
jgi:hypothetical protein